MPPLLQAVVDRGVSRSMAYAVGETPASGEVLGLWVLVFLHAVGLAGLPVASTAARHGRTRNPATPFI